MNQDLITLIPTLPLIQNKGDINEATRLEEDLKLGGHHARLFIFKYADTFNVDISGFKFNKYFSNDGSFSSMLPSFLRKKHYPLTLGELDMAIRYGRLNDDTLKEIASNTRAIPPRKRILFSTSTRYKPEEIIIFVLTGIAITILLAWLTLLWIP